MSVHSALSEQHYARRGLTVRHKTRRLRHFLALVYQQTRPDHASILIG